MHIMKENDVPSVHKTSPNDSEYLSDVVQE